MMNIFKYIPQKLAIDTSKIDGWFNDMGDAGTRIFSNAGRIIAVAAAVIAIVGLIFKILHFIEMKKTSHGDEMPMALLSLGIHVLVIAALLSFGITGWGLL